MHPSKLNGRAEAQRDRAVKALELRIAGATYRQIGRQLGVTDKTAFYDVQKELGSLDALVKRKAERLRELEARRLDVLTVALTAGVRNGDPSACRAMVSVMERRAKLLRLDLTPEAPTARDEAPVTIVFRFASQPPAVIDVTPDARALLPTHENGNGDGHP
jgi:hypothetical protein